MLNKLSSAWRYLRREYPMSSAATVGVTLFGFGFGLVAGLGMAVTMGSLMCGIGLASAYFTDEPGHRGSNSAAVGGCTVTGAVRDVAAVVSTQRLINDYTDKLRHLRELPPKTARKIAAHVADIQGALSRCQFYTKDGQDFCFTRPVLNGVANGWAAVSAPIPAQRDMPFAAGEPLSMLPLSGALSKDFAAGRDNGGAKLDIGPAHAPKGPRM